MPLFVKQEGVWELERNLAMWDARLCLGSLRSDHRECPKKMPHCPPHPQGPPVDIPGALGGGHGDHLRLHILASLVGMGLELHLRGKAEMAGSTAGEVALGKRRSSRERPWDLGGAGEKNGRDCSMSGLGNWQCQCESW